MLTISPIWKKIQWNITMVITSLLNSILDFTSNPAVILIHAIGFILWSSVIGSQVKLRSAAPSIGLSEVLLVLVWLLGYLHGLSVVLVTYIWVVVFETSIPLRCTVRKGATFVGKFIIWIFKFLHTQNCVARRGYENNRNSTLHLFS